MTFRKTSLMAAIAGLSLCATPAAWAQDNTARGGVYFGDDSSQWSNDGECDDPRFEGRGMAETLIDADRFADASDCQALFERGQISLQEGASAQPVNTDGINFGDDSGSWAQDGECDDPRFVGPGMAADPEDEDKLRDATDCRSQFMAGRVSLRTSENSSYQSQVSYEGIYFGNDNSDWALNGECDDPRFDGPGMADYLIDGDRENDASDCLALFQDGKIWPKENGPTVSTIGGIDFGDDNGQWANDGECDDPRFEGRGMAETLIDEDRLHDASDCQALYEAGSITLIGSSPTEAPSETEERRESRRPADSVVLDGINFGDDNGMWANDGECDDPRFEGPGMASYLIDADLFSDASDCKAQYENGQITLRDDIDAEEEEETSDNSLRNRRKTQD